MGKPAARLGDMHVCPMVTPAPTPVPHVGGPILPPCSINVLTGKIPQARITDMCLCVGPPDIIVLGSTGVFVNKIPAARLGDQCAHGGTIVVGMPTVLIGETGGGGGAAGGAGGGAGSSASSRGSAPSLLSFTTAKAQAKVLEEAGKAGTPFAEICFGKGG